jgi:hypothetical protein
VAPPGPRERNSLMTILGGDAAAGARKSAACEVITLQDRIPSNIALSKAARASQRGMIPGFKVPPSHKYKLNDS